MAQRIKANINPDILIWARQTAGYSLEEAAKKIGISLNTLQTWESGEDKPTLRQLRVTGNVYKRPTALFYKKITPSDPPVLPDFRLIHDVEHQYSPYLRFEIRRAFERRSIAIELTSQLGEVAPEFDLTTSLNDSPELVAHKIRDVIKISIEEQFSWKDHYLALRSWISALETLGIFVFQISNVEIDHMRGFSIGEHPFPIVAINGKDTPRGRIFTLFHELTHIILHNSGVCDLHDTEANPHHGLEAFCNRVAGEFLVPTEALLSQDIVISNSGKTTWEDWQLNNLANKFMISHEVILRRLLILNKTTERFYNQKRQEYLEIYQRLKEENTGGFIPYYRRVLRANGAAYTNLVLNAYYNEKISSRDLSNFLGGIKLDHVGRIEEALSGNGAGGGEA